MRPPGPPPPPPMPPVRKYAVTVPISREAALDYGLVEPTEQERREQAEREARWEQRRQQNRIATDQWLGALATITDPLSRALLDLHARRQENGCGCTTCAECLYGDNDHADWPCNTVRLITAHHGHPAPEWCEFG